ncbi:MAG: lysophospholipid acyltransferase family protein, partial [Acidimicrobiales bacterium]
MPRRGPDASGPAGVRADLFRVTPVDTVRAYRAGSVLAQRTPPAVVDPLRRAGSKLAARRSPERRFIVGRHLQRVVGPQLRGAALSRMIDAAFDAYARYWIDSARLQAMSDAQVDIGFSVEGFEHIEDAFDRGVGPILALPHLGGWEWAGRWLTCRPDYEVTVVVEPLENVALFEWMVDSRESFGMHVVPLGPEAAAVVVRALKANHVVCLLCDRDIGGGGIDVEFFGEGTTLPAGPATMAFRTGAAIIPVGVYQLPNRHHAVCRPAV